MCDDFGICPHCSDALDYVITDVGEASCMNCEEDVTKEVVEIIENRLITLIREHDRLEQMKNTNIPWNKMHGGR